MAEHGSHGVTRYRVGRHGVGTDDDAVLRALLEAVHRAVAISLHGPGRAVAFGTDGSVSTALR